MDCQYALATVNIIRWPSYGWETLYLNVSIYIHIKKEYQYSIVLLLNGIGSKNVVYAYFYTHIILQIIFENVVVQH